MTETELRNIVYKKLRLESVDENIERLTKEQLLFITHDRNAPSYLEACPGSGKTEVVGLKTAFELIDWEERYSGLAVVSFTNNAAKEISNRATKFAGQNATNHPHFIGTLDSFFYKYLFCPFFHANVGFNGVDKDKSPRSIIDERSEADFLKNKKYQAKTLYAVPNKNPNGNPYVGISISANRFYYDILKKDFFVLPPLNNFRVFSTLKDILERPEQIEYLKDKRSDFLTDEIIYQGFWDAKKSFWKDGFVTFRDCELIILRIFHSKKDIKKKFIKRFPTIIIDECQDLSPTQLVILQCLVREGLKIHFIGDLNQSIYKFREVNPGLITDFISKNNLIKLELTNNFRSNQSIVDTFCKIFPKNIVGKETTHLTNCLRLIEYEESEIPQLIDRYKKIIEESNMSAKKEIIDSKKSAIIIRGSTLLNKFRPLKTNSKNPVTILAISLQLWNIEDKASDIMNNALTLFGCFLSKVFYKNEGSSRNQYRQEIISNASWRISLASLISDISKELYPFTDKKENNLTFSKWATELRNLLPEIYNKLPSKALIKLEDVSFQVEKGLGSSNISDVVKSYAFSNNIRTTTIHDVKGETLDSAMIVSSLDRKSKGGHWKDWFNETLTTEDEFEHKRYGYVALSRPKHLLVLATPKLEQNERSIFESVGFRTEVLKTKALF
jgi:DNA helicase-2/ATP-dependent DNA helicase PcrA